MESSGLIKDKEFKEILNQIGFGILLYLGIIFIVYFGYYYFIDNYPHIVENYVLESITMTLEIIVSICTYYVPFAMISKIVKISQKNVLKFPNIKIKSLFAYTCMLISAYFLIVFLFSGIYAVFGVHNQINSVYFSSETVLFRVIYCLYFVLLLPFFEEYAFRGVILQLTSKFGAIFAMVLTSLIYGLFLLGRGDFFTNVVISLILSLIAMMYQSIIPGVIMRMGLNLLIVGSIYLPAEYSWSIGFIAIISYIVTAYHLFKSRNKQIVLNEAISFRKSWKIFFSSFVMIGALILLIAKGAYYFIN